MSLLRAELDRLARAQMARQPSDHTLQPTALVNEAWLRMAAGGFEFHDRQHFLAFAARAMRSVLIDHARRRAVAPRAGGEAQQQPDPGLSMAGRVIDLLALDEALSAFEEVDPELSRLVELLFFGGRSTAEAAVLLGVSQRTVERGWRSARAWLFDRMQGRRTGPAEA